MKGKMSLESRRELILSIGDRYRTGSRAVKRLILDEFEAVTGYHRMHSIRLLKSSKEELGVTPRARPRRYGDAVGEARLLLWEASDRVCSKRLRPMLFTLKSNQTLP